jgi:hypothetical protein
VQAISNTNHGGADGLYSGRIRAVGPSGASVVVPVGLEKEAETYTLTVALIKPDGTPAGDYQVMLFDVLRGTKSFHSDDSGTVKLRLPKGEYLLDQFQEFELAPEDWRFYKLVAPSIKLTSDQHVILDARKARVVNTTVPTPEAEQANSDVGYDRDAPNGDVPGLSSALVNFKFGRMYTLNEGPALPAAELTGHVTSQWGVRGDGRFTNTPYLYGIANHQPGEFVTGFQRTVRPQDLAVVDTAVNATTDRQAQKTMVPVMPEVSGVWVPAVALDAPRSIRYYVDRVPGGWFGEAAEKSDEAPIGSWFLLGARMQYTPGRTYQERWNVDRQLRRRGRAQRLDIDHLREQCALPRR